MIYSFEWDPVKAKSNKAKHKVSFWEATTVFRDSRALTIFDSDHSDVEDRWLTIGFSGSGKLLVTCHTFQEKDDHASIRIFSSRKATKTESQQYGK